jgi:hypothetical protein
MNDLDPLSFAALEPVDRATTLAYWLGPCDTELLEGVDALGIARAMSYQYDIEEQAAWTGYVIPEDIYWREGFAPVAPVQLTRAWSPLPYAIELIGPADWTSIEPDLPDTCLAACVFWAAPRFTRPALAPKSPPDVSRFHRLLVLAVMRAEELGRGVLVAAKPGWSYDHHHEISAETARLMRAVGFVFQDRHA